MTDYWKQLWRDVRNNPRCGWCTGSGPLDDEDRMTCMRPTSVRFGHRVAFEQRGCPEFRVFAGMIEDALSDAKVPVGKG